MAEAKRDEVAVGIAGATALGEDERPPASARSKHPRPGQRPLDALRSSLAGLPASSCALAAIFTAFVVAKCLVFWGGVPHVGGDNAVWSSCAGRQFFSARFWTCHRPPVVPTLHALFGFNELALVWFQVGVGALSFGAFGYAVSRLFSAPFSRILSLSITLGVGLVQPFLIWDLAIRSESISNSLTLLTIAAALLAATSLSGGLSRRLYWPSVVSLTLFGFLAAFARDLNAVLLLLLAPSAAAIALAQPRWRARTLKASILATTLLLAGGASVVNASLAKRYLPPFINVVLLRVLPSPQRLTLFEQRLGMPVTDELLDLSGKTKAWDGNRVLKSNHLAPFRSWAGGHGFRAYQWYLLAHFPQTLAEVWAALPSIAQFRHAPNHRPFPDHGLAAGIARAWYAAPWVRAPRGALALSLVLGLGLLLTASVKQRRAPLLGLSLLLAGSALTFLAFHGDGIEVPRHAIGGWLLIVLGVAVVWVGALERAWELAKRRRAGFHEGRAAPTVAVPTALAATTSGAPTRAVLRPEHRPEHGAEHGAERGPEHGAERPRRFLLAVVGWCGVVFVLTRLGMASADYPNRARSAKVVSAEGTGNPAGPLSGTQPFCFAKTTGAEFLFELSEARPANRLFVFGRGGPMKVLVSDDGSRFKEVAKARKGRIPVGFAGEKPRFVKLATASDEGPCVDDIHYFTAAARAKRSGREED